MRHANTLIQQAADFLGGIENDSAVQDELRQRQHDRYRALRVLHRFQRYRRGVGSYTDIGYTNEEIGRAIDFAIRELRSHFRPEPEPRTPVGDSPDTEDQGATVVGGY